MCNLTHRSQLLVISEAPVFTVLHLSHTLVPFGDCLSSCLNKSHVQYWLCVPEMIRRVEIEVLLWALVFFQFGFGWDL